MNLVWRFPTAKLPEDWQLGILHSSKLALKVIPSPESKVVKQAKHFILHETKRAAINLKVDTSTELQPIQSEGQSQTFLPLSLTPIGKAEKPDYVEARISLEWKAIPKPAR